MRTTYSELVSEDLNMLAAHTTQFWRSRPLQGRRPAAFFAALVVYIIVILVAAPQAQQPQAFNPTATGASVAAVRDAYAGSEIELMVGRSTVINVGAQIARVSLTSADIADALVTSPSQLLVHGKGPGAISMFVWSRGGVVKRYEVSVQRDLTRLSEQVKQLFPNERIDVRGNGRNVVLSGSVSSKDVVDRAINVALGFVEKREDVVTLLQVRLQALWNSLSTRGYEGQIRAS